MENAQKSKILLLLLIIIIMIIIIIRRRRRNACGVISIVEVNGLADPGSNSGPGSLHFPLH